MNLKLRQSSATHYPSSFQGIVKVFGPEPKRNRLFGGASKRFKQISFDVKKQWQKVVDDNSPTKRLVQVGLFLFAAIGCGTFLAYNDLLPDLAKRQPAVTSDYVVQQVANPPVATGPNQDNPLFAAYPSWSQNFSDSAYSQLDARYWQILVGPAQNSNHEAQYYTADSSNLRIENGALRLIATMQSQPQGYKYASARIETQGKQTFLYGRIDVTAKLPRGVGTWPAVWLLPANNKYSDLSPASNSLRYKNGGELDLIEAVGFYPNVVYGVAHTASDLAERPDGTGSYNQITVPSNDTTYNLYSLLWTPDSLIFEVNNKPFFTYQRQDGADYTTWPFDQPFYLIANLALGGSWGGQDKVHFPGDGIDTSALPASLDIQSIYYYPYIGN